MRTPTFYPTLHKKSGNIRIKNCLFPICMNSLKGLNIAAEGNALGNMTFHTYVLQGHYISNKNGLMINSPCYNTVLSELEVRGYPYRGAMLPSFRYKSFRLFSTE